MTVDFIKTGQRVKETFKSITKKASIPKGIKVGCLHLIMVSRQLVYRHFVYYTSSTDISSTDISSTMTFLAEIEAGVMKRILYQENLDECKEFFLTRSGIDKNKRL